MKTLIFFVFAVLISQSAFAESPKKMIREGNKLYKDKKYTDSEIQYRKALEADKKSDKALFNLGNSLYKQQKFGEAKDIYESYSTKDIDKNKISKSYYNLGNSLLSDKKYAESIEAFKNSLRNSPGDMDSKYNLEYAKKKLIEQQQQQQQKQNQQNKQDQQNKDQNKQQQQDQQQQGQQKQQKISKEDAERMLKAIQAEEKKLQKDLKKKARVSSSVKLEKNW